MKHKLSSEIDLRHACQDATQKIAETLVVVADHEHGFTRYTMYYQDREYVIDIRRVGG